MDSKIIRIYVYIIHAGERENKGRKEERKNERMRRGDSVHGGKEKGDDDFAKPFLHAAARLMM